jgi:predicted O-methyltransferase YrrM
MVISGDRITYNEMKMADIIRLINILNECKPKLILEVGCWSGMCTRLFVNYVGKNGGHVDCVDNFKGSPGSSQPLFAKEARGRWLYNFRKDFNIVSLSECNSSDFWTDEKYDLIFIDGDHRYSQVKKDIDHFYPMLAPDGFFCGHDFDGGDFEEIFTGQDYVNGKHHGVIKAVKESFNDIKVSISDGKIDSSVWQGLRKK